MRERHQRCAIFQLHFSSIVMESIKSKFNAVEVHKETKNSNLEQCGAHKILHTSSLQWVCGSISSLPSFVFANKSFSCGFYPGAPVFRTSNENVRFGDHDHKSWSANSNYTFGENCHWSAGRRTGKNISCYVEYKFKLQFCDKKSYSYHLEFFPTIVIDNTK